ncbi:MAG: 4-hydroxybutyrate CoA-transferase [Candidatus Eisenbacteria bacterium]|nr:4-hydroxybutyrate CoA-transferase [Candidatus Eisenbacteria bacterium]
MTWLDGYKKKISSLEEAVSVVQSKNKIYVSGNAATPLTIIKALAGRRDELHGVEVTHVLLLGDDPLSKPEMEGHFRHNSLFVGPADRKAIGEGRADYIPIFLYEIPGLFYSDIIDLDVAFLHLSPPDSFGYMSFGVECLASKAAAECAKIVVAEVNDKMPRTLGNSFIHISQVDKVVEISRELPELVMKDLTEVEEKIGGNIANLVEDGSTIQLGIGGIPNAALKAMYDRKDLGIHTEMVSDGIVDAMERGVVTGAKKTLHPNKAVATFLWGSKKVYEFAHDNPAFEVHPVDYTNHPSVVAKNDRMVAINSAIEVDLTGQVCSDSIGTRIYSGFGGQVDFIRGAAQSRGGKPIIALPATTKDGGTSKIVPYLKQGGGVVTTRADVHYVVTEYGVAYLHGKNLRQRAKALIEIAAPKFRQDLEREAMKRKLI